MSKLVEPSGSINVLIKLVFLLFVIYVAQNVYLIVTKTVPKGGSARII